MEQFIEYQRFSSIEEAKKLTDLLNVNNIPFEIDDSANRFDISATSINLLNDGIVILIKETDKEEVDKLNEENAEFPPHNDHYMYMLSDDDIIDAVVNPSEWTAEENHLAKDIMKHRNLKPTAEIIKNSRDEKIKTEKEDNLKQKKSITNGASWFLWIAILSMINLVMLIANQNLQFIVGLGVNYFILGVMAGVGHSIGTNLLPLGYVLSFLFSGLFLFFWRKSKSENKTIYLIGLIVYGLDSLIFLFSKEWLGLGFHIFVFFGLANGYSTLITKKSEENNSY